MDYALDLISRGAVNRTFSSGRTSNINDHPLTSNASDDQMLSESDV